MKEELKSPATFELLLPLLVICKLVNQSCKLFIFLSPTYGGGGM